MTLRGRERGVQTAWHRMSSGVLRRAPLYEPKTFGDGSRDARARRGYARGEINDALRQGIAVLELYSQRRAVRLFKGLLVKSVTNPTRHRRLGYAQTGIYARSH